METEFQNAVGKGAGEVMRDIAEFLSLSFVINEDKGIDLCTLLPDLNMAEQFSFALLSEAYTQGWEPDAAESFYRNATASILPTETVARMVEAFRQPEGEMYQTYQKKYGNRFSLLDGSYWATCLALAIDAEKIGEVMHYLRLFTVTLMEFAYMENRNPSTTYTWSYYEAFRKMLDDLVSAPDPDPLPLKIRAVGGSAGKREGDSYPLSLGVDIENPNHDRMACGVSIDITLKDKDGNTITVIKDRIKCIDPATVYHYGVTRKIRGGAVANISAVAKAAHHLKLSTPIMKHIKLSSFRMSRPEGATKITATLSSEYDKPLASLAFHYQILSANNKILGGGNEWVFDGIAPSASFSLTSNLPLSIPGAAKALYSVDFDALELIKDEP